MSNRKALVTSLVVILTQGKNVLMTADVSRPKSWEKVAKLVMNGDLAYAGAKNGGEKRLSLVVNKNGDITGMVEMEWCRKGKFGWLPMRNFAGQLADFHASMAELRNPVC